MRPRINSFGQITRNELEIYFTENRVYGFTAKRNDKTIIYSYFIMFRNNKGCLERLFVEVSRTSKFAIKAWTDKGKKFNNINELKMYTKNKR